MKITAKNGCCRWVVMSLVFVLALALVEAQTNSAQGPDRAQPEAPAKATAVDRSTAGRAHNATYVIGVDDVLAINVWKEPEVSKTVPVRSDGKISLPLAGEVQASGQTPRQLEQELSAKLKSYIAEPEVTVIVEQIKSQKFNVLGQVTRPGSYPLTNSPTVLDAIALAGGFRDFAKQKAIYVLRQNADGTQSRMPFNYKEVIKGKNSDQNIKLQSNDTIVVP
jgi:polysaccharide biosynthesis/export protein